MYGNISQNNSYPGKTRRGKVIGQEWGGGGGTKLLEYR